MSGEGKASFSVLLKPVHAVCIAAILQSPACDVMVKGSVKGQGKRRFFPVVCELLIKNNKGEMFSVTSAIFLRKELRLSDISAAFFKVIQHWHNCSI